MFFLLYVTLIRRVNREILPGCCWLYILLSIFDGNFRYAWKFLIVKGGNCTGVCFSDSSSQDC